MEDAGAKAACCSPRPSPIKPATCAANDIARQFAEERIREIVTDPVVATDLIPVDHPIGTKRICTDTGYYATFNRDNVRLVNLRREPIDAITADAVRTNEATYPCDVLIFATGFDAMTGALTRINPSGPGGERLRDIWADGPRDLPRPDGARPAEPVHDQRPGQPVGPGEHGAARRGSGRLGHRSDTRRATTGRRRGRAPPRRGRRLDRPRCPSCRADAVPQGRVVVVPGRQYRRQEANLHALHRRVRHLPAPLQRCGRSQLRRVGVDDRDQTRK